MSKKPKHLKHTKNSASVWLGIMILALILGGEFFGILGMFMAAPVAAIIKAVGKRIIAQLV